MIKTIVKSTNEGKKGRELSLIELENNKTHLIMKVVLNTNYSLVEILDTINDNYLDIFVAYEVEENNVILHKYNKDTAIIQTGGRSYGRSHFFNRAVEKFQARQATDKN